MLRIVGICPSFHFTVRFAEDHGRLTGWHYLHRRNVWERENKRKNDEECGEEGNKRGMRSSPPYPSIECYPGDQKDLVTRSERPKDLVSTFPRTIPSVNISMATRACKRPAQETPSHAMVKNIKARGNMAPGKLLRHPHECLTAEDHCRSAFYLFVCWKHLLPPSGCPASPERFNCRSLALLKKFSLLPAQRLICCWKIHSLRHKAREKHPRYPADAYGETQQPQSCRSSAGMGPPGPPSQGSPLPTFYCRLSWDSSFLASRFNPRL